VIATYAAGDDEPTEVLEGRYRVKPRHWVQQLDRSRRVAGSVGTKEVEELSAA